MKLRPLAIALTICAFAVIIAALHQRGPRSASAAFVQMIAASDLDTCARTLSGGVKCWGDNTHGQLGDGTTTQRSAPVDVCATGAWNGSTCAGGSALTGVTFIATGAYHTCAVMTGGGVKCWGGNGSGELGDGTTTERHNPVDVCAVGSGAGCAANNITAPDTTSILGRDSSIVLDASGFPVISYYDISNGDLKLMHCGNANCTSGNSLTSLDTVGNVGYFTSMRLDASGKPVVSYYDATNGALKLLHCGNTNCTSANSVVTADNGCYGEFPPPPPCYDVGFTSSLTLDASGFPVISYYDLSSGNLNVLHCINANCTGASSIEVPDATGDVGIDTSISLDGAGKPIVTYIDQTNTHLKVLHCGTTTCSTGNTITSPDSGTLVPAYRQSFTLDASGFPVIGYYDQTNGDLKVLHCGNANCNSGNVFASPDTVGDVGSDVSIRLDGSGNPVASYRDLTNNDLKVIHCGNSTCTAGNVITSPDTVGNVGSYGTSLRLDSSGFPVVSYWDATNGNLKVLHCGTANCNGAALTGASMLSLGAYHTCARMTSTGVKCWGQNGSGQLGNNYGGDSANPIDVCANGACASSLTGASSVTANGYYTCALVSGGVQCWGDNFFGQLGDGNAGIGSGVPVDVCIAVGCPSHLSDATAVDAGGYHACAVVTGGEVRCWGYNADGELGDGTTGDSDAPVIVCGDELCTSPLTGAVAVDGGGFHTCARISGGTAKCWGFNGYGEFGDGNGPNGSDTPRNVCGDPQCSAPLQSVVSSAGGAWHTCFQKASTGNVYCTGLNNTGQLGNGTTSDSDVPVAVASLGTKPTATAPATATPTPLPLTFVAPNLHHPWGVFLTNSDGSGSGEEGGGIASGSDSTTIYYAESGGNQVHGKVLKSSVETFAAGSGSPGYDCNNCLAVSAMLNGPRDVFYSAADGYVYIADTQNCLVRKVDTSTGMITNVAGKAPNPVSAMPNCGYDGEGTAINQELNKPSGVAVGTIGGVTYVYIADTLNCLVRKVNTTNGQMSTVAGSVPTDPPTNTPKCGTMAPYQSGPAPDDYGAATSAILRYPYDVTLVYPDIDLLIAEGADTAVDGVVNGHNRIRRVNVLTGRIITVIGGGDCVYPYTTCRTDPLNVRLDNPEGVAAADYKIYVAQAGDTTNPTPPAHPIVSVHSLTNAVAPETFTVTQSVDYVKGVAVNSKRTNNGTRTLAISDYGTTSSNGWDAAGNDTSGNPSASYQPSASCTTLPGIQSIDWLLPAALLGLIVTRKRLRTLFIVLRSAAAAAAT